MTEWRTIAEDVPAQALPLMAHELSQYGAEVEFTGSGRGFIRSISGTAVFRLEANRFDVKLVDNPNHFPERLIFGGMRQFVEEAVEKLKRVEV
jgi:hypothetical protein